MHKEIWKKVENKINIFNNQLFGSYLSQDKHTGAPVPIGRPSKEIEEMINRKVEKDEMRSFMDNEEQRYKISCKQTQTLNEHLK